MDWQHHCLKLIYPTKLDSNLYVTFTGTFCRPFAASVFPSVPGDLLQNLNLISKPATQVPLFGDKNKTKAKLLFPVILLTQT